jgi:hypothetical protein
LLGAPWATTQATSASTNDLLLGKANRGNWLPVVESFPPLPSLPSRMAIGSGHWALKHDSSPKPREARSPGASLNFRVRASFRRRLRSVPFLPVVPMVKVHQEGTPMAHKPKRKKITQLPLIADCQASMRSNPALDGPGVAPTLTAQLESLGGDIYQMPLSVRAARGMLLALAAWEPLCEVMQGSKCSERPKSQ